MFERFTDRARQVVVRSQEEARLLGHDYIGTEHVVLGLAGIAEGIAGRALAAAGQSHASLVTEVEQLVGRGSGARSGHVPFTRDAKKTLELGLREALQMGHNYIGTEHILLGMIRIPEAAGTRVLEGRGVDLTDLRATVLKLIEGFTDPATNAAVTLVPIEVVECALCGRRRPESGVLVEGAHGGRVCEHCVRAAAELLADPSDFGPHHEQTGLHKLPPPDVTD
jgi:ATP-dependent Clp protease ATP-binding subunit ClpA